MSAPPQTQSFLRTVVRIDRTQLDVTDAAVATVALLGLLGLRLLIGPVIFTAGVAAFVTMLFARNARYLWKVFLFVAAYGTLVTVVAQHLADRNAAAVVFVWLVTFASGLAILMPVTNAVVSLINLWAVVAMNVTASSGTASQSAGSWLLGTAIAIAIIWVVRRRRFIETDEPVDFTRESFQIHPRIRKHVLIFALGRATAVGIAGVIGIAFFPGNHWLAALAALVVIGINPEKSRLVAIQRGVGTFAGVAIAMLAGSLVDSIWGLAPLLIATLFLAMLVRSASPLYFAACLTVTLLLISGLRSDTPLKLAGGRLAETVIGIGIGLLAIRVLHPTLEPIVAFVQERARARQASKAGAAEMDAQKLSTAKQ